MSSVVRPRVVFVDDDPLVLRSIRRLMERRLKAWDLGFFETGAEALESIRENPADVVVSDLNMGRMDGAVLLKRVQEATPQVVRIVLSGSTSRTEACQTASSAHQFLSKPFDSKTLADTLRRAASMRSILDSPALRKLVAGKNELPTLPETYLELTELLASDDASLAELAGLVERDPGLAARLMQLTSSAFIGRREPPANVRQAVIYAGTTMIKALVLTHHIVEQYRPKVATFSMQEVQQHALRTAAIASEMLASSEAQGEGFLGGMLHLVGRVVLATRAPAAYQEVLRMWDEEGVTIAAAERSILGATHAEVGAYLFGLWGLPHAVVESVALANRPAEIRDTSIGPVSAVHIASRLAVDPDRELGVGGESSLAIDRALVDRVGVAGRLPAWRARARSVIE